MRENNPNNILLDQAENLIWEMECQQIPIEEEITREQHHELLYDPFGKKSPVQLNLTDPEALRQIPLFNLVHYLGTRLQKEGRLQLTRKGRLRAELVYEIQQQGFYQNDVVVPSIHRRKQLKETDIESVALAHILARRMNLCKRHGGFLYLTEAGKAMMKNDVFLAHRLIETFATCYSWASVDNNPNEFIGQICFGYSLILLYKYGSEMREIEFYSEKYLDSLKSILLVFGGADDPWGSFQAYKHRFFELFLQYLGVVEFDDSFFMEKVRINHLFDQVFRIRLDI